ncbi:hypothetical protein ACIO14_19325 [Nocardia fluminea]|uniref:hypothetical protein n=1 Tax=Nocardia fluminea TaxID=134984 RepID=UPI0037FB4919
MIAVSAARVLIPVIALVTATVTLIAVSAARVLIPVIALVTATISLIAITAARVGVSVAPAIAVVPRDRDQADSIAVAESTATGNLGGAESPSCGVPVAGDGGRLSNREAAVAEEPQGAHGTGHDGCSPYSTDCHAPSVPSSIAQLSPLRSDPAPRALRTGEAAAHVLSLL